MYLHRALRLCTDEGNMDEQGEIMKNTIVGGLAVLATAAATWTATAVPASTSTAIAGAEGTVVTGCVIRLYSSGPAIHANGAHACTGAEGTPWIDDRGYLHVSQAVDAPVVSVVANPDETLVKRGIQAGVSGGVSESVIAMYDSRLGRELDLADPADYKRAAGIYSNLWLTWVQQP